MNESLKWSGEEWGLELRACSYTLVGNAGGRCHHSSVLSNYQFMLY